MSTENKEFAKFDTVVQKVFSVSHDEIKRREKQWKQKRLRAKQKRARTSPASRASNAED
ncbi:MAG: hypothetical protein LAO30_26165 [Acidobacteriia bacterium]|nr:hypothetical protein [Terriglobia bacterium]